MQNEKQYRKCEICGKTDVETRVYGSGIGPVSFNYCTICVIANAEPKELMEALIEEGCEFPNKTFYDIKTDSYYNIHTIKVFKFFIRREEVIVEKRADFALHINEWK